MAGILEQLGVLFILIGAGVVAARLGILTEAAVAGVNKLVIRACLPALILANMDKAFTLNALQDSLWLIAISVAAYAAVIAFLEIWRRASKRPKAQLAQLQFLVLLGNTAFMGYPVVNAIYGSDGVFYASVFNMVYNFIAFSYGLFLLQRDKGVKFGAILFNGALVSTVAGFILFLLPLTLPYVLHRPLEWAGEMTIPLSLLVVGFNMAHIKPQTLARPRAVWVPTLIRLAAFPAALAPALFLLGFRGMLLGIPVLIFATPVALTAGALVQEHGSGGELAGKTVILSNLLSIVTLPAWAAALSALAGKY